MNTGCTYRYRNAKHVIKHVRNLNIPVIVAEQVTHRGITFPDVYTCKVYTDNPLFCKAMVLNKASKETKTSHMWVIDADCFYKYENYVTEITKYDFYQPFSKCKDLNETQTQQLIECDSITNPMISPNHTDDRVIKMYGAMSFGINLTRLTMLGGFNETYEGYGYEDYDLYIKARQHNIYRENNIAVHMWHPPTTCGMLENKAKFESTGWTKQQILHELENIYDESTIG